MTNDKCLKHEIYYKQFAFRLHYTLVNIIRKSIVTNQDVCKSWKFIFFVYFFIARITSGSRHYRPTPSSAYGIIHLGPIFATRKVVAPFSNIQSSWADQYGSIDTWNIKIRPLVIILWQNILVHQQGALNSLLTTIPNRNYCANRSGLIL